MLLIKKILFGVFLISGTASLLSLGFWQVERLEWKTGIIDKLEAEYATGNSKRNFTYEELSLVTSELPLRYGSVQGRFDYTKEILIGPKPLDGKIGYHVITPLSLVNGGTILVNRGWIENNKIENLSQNHTRENIRITGVFRKPDWNRFTPNNSPENNVWSKIDIGQIASIKNLKKVAPLVLYTEESSKEFGNLILQQQKWLPRNKHKQYAIFWFSMAAVFLGIFGYFVKNSGLQKKSS